MVDSASKATALRTAYATPVNAEEARIRLEEAARHRDAGRLEEAGSLYSAIISGLPRDSEGQQELFNAYEELIRIRGREGRTARALRLFRQYVGDCAPVCDPAYDQMYEEGLLATKTPPVPLRRRQRFHTLVQLFRQTLPLEGWVAECGCFRGLSSYLLCSTLKGADGGFIGRGYRIFDSFMGLSAPQPEDAIADTEPDAEEIRGTARAGRLAAPLDHVKAALSSFPHIEFFPGWLPEAFPDDPGARYRFIHVDVDLYQPTRDSLEYFSPRMTPGGIIVCDDYGWPGARKAVEEFSARASIPFRVTSHHQAWFAYGA